MFFAINNFLRKTSLFAKTIILLFVVFFVSFQISISAPGAGFRVNIIPGPQCYDGLDNDSDGKIDYPADPDCDSKNDNSEAPLISSGGSGGTGGSSGGGGGGSSPGITIDPVASVVLSGLSFPVSTVSVLKDGQLVSQVKSDAEGLFKSTLSDLSPGQYLFTLYSFDNKNRKSDNFTFSLQVNKGATTNIGGIFIAPTLELDKNFYTNGEELIISGQSLPGAEITVKINSAQEHILQSVTDRSGFYSFKFNNKDLEIGSHSAKAKSKYKGQESSYSRVFGFDVLEKGAKPEETAKKPVITWKVVDVNDDNKVNLVDFSVLAFWYKKSNPPKSTDINGDGVVNIIDFSIMAYHWTG